MLPAEHVRLALIECRDRRLPFPDAWQIAVQSLPRPREHEARVQMREWKEALAWARPFYAAAYAGQPFGGLPPLEQPVIDAVLAEVA